MYRKIKILFIALSLSLSLLAQEEVLDSAYLKVMYQYVYLSDTLELTTREDLLVLQIGKNLSKCYSYYSNQSDSIHKNGGKAAWQAMFNKAMEDFNKHRNRAVFMNSFPRRRTMTYTYRNYPTGKMTVTDFIGSEDLIYEDEMHAQEWEIGDSVKTILDYNCQKATCNFRGRAYEAWFAPDIPVSEGPWMFSGLPGLIMEVYDTRKHYVFQITGLQQVENEPIVFSEPLEEKAKYKKTSRIEFLRMNMRYLKFGVQASMGYSSEETPVFYDLIERDYK